MPNPIAGGGNNPQVARQQQMGSGGGSAPVTSPNQLPQGQPMGAGQPAQSVGDKLADVFMQITAEGLTPQVASALESFFLSLQQLSPGAQGQGMQQSPQPQQPPGQAAPPQFAQGGNALNVPQPPPR